MANPIRKLGPDSYLLTHTPAGGTARRDARKQRFRGTLADARVALAEHVLKVEREFATKRTRSQPRGLPSIGLADWCPQWVARRRHAWSDKTLAQRKRFAKMLATEWGTTPLHAIDRYALQEWYREQMEAGRNATTATWNVKTLRTVLNAARELYRVPARDELGGVQFSRCPKKRGRAEALEDDQLARLFVALHEQARDLVPMVACAYLTGMRPGEVLAFRWDWIDWKREQILVGDRHFTTKTKRTREIPLPSELPAFLQLFPRESVYCFPVRRGHCRGAKYTQWPKVRFRRVLDACGLKGFDSYSLRHTFVSRFCDQYRHPQALEQAGKLVGHSSRFMTENYAHMMRGRFEQSRDVVTMASIIPPRLRLAAA